MSYRALSKHLFKQTRPIRSKNLLKLHHEPRPKPILVNSLKSIKNYSSSILNGDEKEKLLQPLLKNGWSLAENKNSLTKQYIFKNFNEAYGFMSRVALSSEKLNHHPEWTNIYNKVVITWTTHSDDTLSTKDIKMATLCDKYS